ncbi:chromatin organization [Teratosphaeria destructans]|uniref:Chromatin organization n=1 Tax=Teratosphaeria destructans TaxID=418781 RepID=A0A9W7W1S3_9PEZI|nr:chromatin organization [Teratosphaeria destructans]
MPKSHATLQPEHERYNSNNSPPSETVEEDDICPICQLLLHNPVKTACNHTLCKSCMATWADVSLAAPMTIVSVDEEPRDFDAATGLEARCPMCRAHTSATIDDERATSLRTKYPQTFAERQAEEVLDEDAHEGVQTITVYIGNRHELVEPEAESPNMHQWTFFVRPSRRDIIEEVQIFLHPTFRPSRSYARVRRTRFGDWGGARLVW